MHPLLFATSNTDKFTMAHALCERAGITLEQIVLDIDEIQSEDPEVIVRDKAQKAYDAVGKPVVVSDDSWSIAGLRGFPGPYMKSINHWFRPENFIDLTKNLSDRTITLTQYLAYTDEYETVIFRRDITGKLLNEPRGEYGVPLLKVVALDSDNGLSIAEVYDQSKAHDPKRLKDHPDVWRDLIKWYQKKEEV